MASSPESFKIFCDVCERLQKTPKPGEKNTLLADFIQAYKEMDRQILQQTSSIAKPSFYPAMRLLVPEFERERGPYGLKEIALAKILISALCLNSLEEKKLLNYKMNMNTKKGDDFADVAFWILKRRCSSAAKLTIADVNERLNTLALYHSENKPKREIERHIYMITKSATAVEMKWIIRIILKDMKLGMGNNRILKVFHEDAPDLYDVCSDLSKVCEDLNDPKKRLHELEITTFTPFRPMLSLKCDKTVLDTEVTDNRLFYIENKFDGERFQLHMRNGVFKYFSKNGYEYTNTYGDTYDSSGLITPYLKSMFRRVKNIILDGEMMGWNKKTKAFGSKGMNYDVKNLKDDSVHRPCFCVFDILLYNDKVLTDLSLKERLSILNELITDINGVIVKSKIIEAKSKEDILRELNKSADNQEEGICFKDPNSIYKPNNRKAGWWKMKLEYFEGLMTELDVIILGGYYGEGRRNGLISSFLLGVAVTPLDAGASPQEFFSFAKVASGFTIKELDELVQKLKPYFKPVNKNERPEGILWTKEKPDVWVEPRHSYILQVKASELAKSSEFQTKYTLRFPRVEKIRYDKPWYNCMTTEELKELTSSSKAVEKLNNRHITAEDVEVVPKKRRRQELTQVTRPTLEEGELKSNLFRGKEIYICTGNEQYSVQVLEKKVLEHGGKLVKIDGPNNFCIIVGDITTAVHILKRNSPRDIVKLDWFIKAIEYSTEKILEWTPDDLLNMSRKTKKKLSKYYDKYGDSYTEIVSREKLDLILKRVDSKECSKILSPEEIMDFEKILEFKNPLSLFRTMYAYFDKPETNVNLNDILHGIANDFRFFGGAISKKIDQKTTHIIVHSSDLSRVSDIKQEISMNNYNNIKIVNECWIPDCIISGTKFLENVYFVE